MDADGSKENHRTRKAIEFRESLLLSLRFDYFNLQYLYISKVQISNISRIGFFLFLSLFPIDPILIPWLRSDTTTSMLNWWVHPLLFDFLCFCLEILIRMISSFPFIRFFSGTWVLGNPVSFCALSRVNFLNFRLFFQLFIWFFYFDWEILQI